jgi:hypothetical protein
VRAPRVIATASLPGRPGRVLAAPAVRSSQAQIHVTNFDYNQHPLNTMPGTRLTSQPAQPPAARSPQPSGRAKHTTTRAMRAAARATDRVARAVPVICVRQVDLAVS